MHCWETSTATRPSNHLFMWRDVVMLHLVEVRKNLPDTLSNAATGVWYEKNTCVPLLKVTSFWFAAIGLRFIRMTRLGWMFVRLKVWPLPPYDSIIMGEQPFSINLVTLSWLAHTNSCLAFSMVYNTLSPKLYHYLTLISGRLPLLHCYLPRSISESCCYFVKAYWRRINVKNKRMIVRLFVIICLIYSIVRYTQITKHSVQLLLLPCQIIGHLLT